MKNSCHFFVLSQELGVLFEDQLNFFLELCHFDTLNLEDGVLFFKHGELGSENIRCVVGVLGLSVWTALAIWSLSAHFNDIIISYHSILSLQLMIVLK